MSTAAPSINRTKIRVGLVIISALFLAAVVLVALVDDPIGHAIFVGVAVMAVVRVGLLVRWLRRDSGLARVA